MLLLMVCAMVVATACEVFDDIENDETKIINDQSTPDVLDEFD